MEAQQWHTQPIEEVREILDTSPQSGLTSEQVRSKQERFGLNALPPPPKKSPWKILLNQFNDILIHILIIAAVVTLVLAFVTSDTFSVEYFFDTIVIVVVLIINATIGFYQEIKAEKAVTSLQSLISEQATVYRNGKLEVIEAKYLVPGDVVEFNLGERIPADLRLIVTNNVKINESALTGESYATTKRANSLVDEDTSLGDRKNMAFMGTIVESGKGKGIVIATGEETEVGKITSLVANIGEVKTPLQKKLEEFSHILAKLIIVVSLFLIVFGGVIEFLHAESRENILETVLGLTVVGVSLAVAAIPEGLPIILTFTLAISVQKMAKQNAIIRNLEAVETLGSTTFIATDKTGTLTENRLKLVQINSATDQIQLGGDSRTDKFDKVIEIMAATTASVAILDKDDEKIEQIADPLDLAIQNALNTHMNPNRSDEKIIYEFPFDSERKMMSVLIQDEKRTQLMLKGAPDAVLSKSVAYLNKDGEEIGLGDEMMKNLTELLDSLAQGGYRVIGVAYRTVDPQIIQNEDLEAEEMEQGLVFAGFLNFIDPPRAEVYQALETCYQAGIRVVMITGDHPKTALTIAKDLGIAKPETGNVLVGKDLDGMDEDQLGNNLLTTNVFARVTPAHKLRLVSLLKEKGEIVAMTGDGVNDSPALVKADIGIAMGRAGTDAAKEASDMILLDDNFATIVETVEEGRVVKSNIRKFTNYLLASNSSEVLLLIFGFFFIAMFQPLLIRELIPLSETQILYLNLVTDSFLALALGLEKREQDVMEQEPLAPDTPIVTREDAIRIGTIGLMVALASIVIFAILLGHPDTWTSLSHQEIAYAQSFTLTFLVLSEVFIAISYRSNQRIHQVGFFSNRLFIVSIVIILIGQIGILYIPLFNSLFDTQPLKLVDWFIILPLSLLVFVGLEMTKSGGISEVEV